MKLRKSISRAIILAGFGMAIMYKFALGFTPVWLDISAAIFFLAVIAIGLVAQNNDAAETKSESSARPD